MARASPQGLTRLCRSLDAHSPSPRSWLCSRCSDVCGHQGAPGIRGSAAPGEARGQDAHGHDDRARPLVSTGPSATVARDQSTQPDVVTPQGMHGLEALEEPLAGGGRLQPTRWTQSISDRHVAALNALGGVAAPPVEPSRDVSCLRRGALHRLDVGLVMIADRVRRSLPAGGDGATEDIPRVEEVKG